MHLPTIARLCSDPQEICREKVFRSIILLFEYISIVMLAWILGSTVTKSALKLK